MASFGAFGKKNGIGPHKFRLNAKETVFKTGKRRRLCAHAVQVPWSRPAADGSGRANLRFVGDECARQRQSERAGRMGAPVAHGEGISSAQEGAGGRPSLWLKLVRQDVRCCQLQGVVRDG